MIIGYINGQSLELHHSKVVEKSVDYLTADFQFMTNEWTGFRKWVHFSKGDIHYQIELKNDKILKTDHLNLSSGEWDVYIHGSLEREIITTNKAKLVVEVTGDLEGQYPEETPIPPYDYILNKIGNLEGLETEAKENLVAAINEIFQTVNDDKRVGVVEIKQTISSSENGGLNEITISFTDGTVKTFTYHNGQKGEKGDKGDKGEKGEDGEDYVLTDSDKEEIAEKVTLNNDVGNAVKATANGEVIRVDDVSPIEHKVKAKISGDGINPQNVILYRYGKNLFDINNYIVLTPNIQSNNKEQIGHKYIVKGSQGSKPLAYSTGAIRFVLGQGVKNLGKITVSLYVTLLEQGVYDNNVRVFGGTKDTDPYNFTLPLTLNVREKLSIVFDVAQKMDFLSSIMFYLNNNKVLFELDTMQIETGDTSTEYEECDIVSCVPDADGTAEILSASPTMTLFTDTDGANIEIEYNQDINTALGDVKEDIRELDRVISELPSSGGDSDKPNINIDDVFEKTTGSVNLYQPTTEGWIDNTYIRLSGETTASNNYCISPKIPVAPNTTYSINSVNYSEYLCYDSNDNYIGYSSVLFESDYVYGTTKENTAYIRLNVPNRERESFNTRFMLVEGIGIVTSGYGFKAFIREIGDLSLLNVEDKYKKNLVTAINQIMRFSTLTEETKTEIAKEAAGMIDIPLSTAIGSGVLE